MELLVADWLKHTIPGASRGVKRIKWGDEEGLGIPVAVLVTIDVREVLRKQRQYSALDVVESHLY